MFQTSESIAEKYQINDLFEKKWKKNVTISILLPCLNEEKALKPLLSEIRGTLQEYQRRRKYFCYEIIVVDNGSEDNSAIIAAENGAKVIHENKRGYGNAYRTGLSVASGDYLVMMDADGTYDPQFIPLFVELLHQDIADLVIGTRFKGKMASNAMPRLHRYIGNPMLTWILNILFRVALTDAHSGMRAIKKQDALSLNLTAEGMEFATELIVKAILKNLRIKEVPISYRPRVKGTTSKLHPLRDGYRHLKYLIYSRFAFK